MASSELTDLMRFHAMALRQTFKRTEVRTGTSYAASLAMCERMEEIADRLDSGGPDSLDEVDRRELERWRIGLNRGVADAVGGYLSPTQKELDTRMRRMIELVGALYPPPPEA